MVKFKKENKLLDIFNFSSLTDIIFLLLIYFLLTSSFFAKSGIEVNIPEASNSNEKPVEPIILVITSKGEYFLNEQKIKFQEISQYLSSLIKNDTNKVIVINADKNISLQTTVDVIDIAKSVGVSKFFISTSSKKNEKK